VVEYLERRNQVGHVGVAVGYRLNELHLRSDLRAQTCELKKTSVEFPANRLLSSNFKVTDTSSLPVLGLIAPQFAPSKVIVVVLLPAGVLFGPKTMAGKLATTI